MATDKAGSGRSAAWPWLGDRPPHLPCGRGELPSRVLFPGDPGRVDRFARVLDGFEVLGQNREFRVARGSYRGVALGVCSTGIGGPSTEIALVEAASLGCRVALRVGGTGALDAATPLGSLLVVEQTLRGGGAAALYAAGDRRALADVEVLAAIVQAAEVGKEDWRRCTVASIDGYYAGQGRGYPGGVVDEAGVLGRYRALGVSALDMEAETMLVIGRAVGMKAGAILAVHANRGSDTWLEDYEPAQDRLIRTACEAMLLIGE